MHVRSLKQTIIEIRPHAVIAARFRPAAVGFACGLIFLSSELHFPMDSQYALVTAHTMLRYGTPTLDRWFAEPASGGAGWPRSFHVIREGQHDYYIFPYGGSFLAAPIVGLVELLGGPRVVTADGQYDRLAEQQLQMVIAAGLMSVAVAIWYWSARRLLPEALAAVLAVGTALGTSVWSTAALTLWCQTWAVFLLSCSLALVIAADIRGRRVNTILLGSLLAWCFLVRPTMALSAVAITAYFGIRRSRQCVSLALTGGVWFAAFLAWCQMTYGEWLPWYFRTGRLNFAYFGEALAGNLVSPGRGFFVYIPVAAYLVYASVRYARFSRHRPLAWMAAACIIVHWVVVSGFCHWWGGYSFGPRLQLEMIPWWFVLAMVAEDGRRHAEIPRRRRALELSIATALLAGGITIHGIGANSLKVAEWNPLPVSVDAAPERVWDWSDVPFLRPWTISGR